MRRKKQTRELRAEYLVLCEDAKSAQDYIKECINTFGKDIKKFSIRQAGIHASSPKNILEEVKKFNQKKQSDYNEIFCIYDKDTHDDRGGHYTKLCDWIQSNGSERNVTDARSVPCFEYWLLLHFCYTDKPFPSADDLLSALKKYVPNYDKGGLNFQDYQVKISDAIQNAKKSEVAFSKPERGIKNENPVTFLHKLIEFIRDKA